MPNLDQEFVICGGPSENDLWDAIRHHKACRVPFRIHPSGDGAEECKKHTNIRFDKLIGAVWVELNDSLHVTALHAEQRIEFWWIPGKAQGAIQLPEWMIPDLEWR